VIKLIEAGATYETWFVPRRHGRPGARL